MDWLYAALFVALAVVGMTLDQILGPEPVLLEQDDEVDGYWDLEA